MSQKRYGPWRRVRDLFARLLTHSQEKGKPSWEVSVDSTTTRGHVQAAGARTDSATRHPGEPADHGFGRSRGESSTKIHVGINADCEVTIVSDHPRSGR